MVTKKLYTSLVNSSMGTTKNNVYIWLQRNFTLHLSILQWVPLKIMFTYDYKELYTSLVNSSMGTTKNNVYI